MHESHLLRRLPLPSHSCKTSESDVIPCHAIFAGGEAAAVASAVQVDPQKSLSARLGQAEPATGIVVDRYDPPPTLRPRWVSKLKASELSSLCSREAANVPTTSVVRRCAATAHA